MASSTPLPLLLLALISFGCGEEADGEAELGAPQAGGSGVEAPTAGGGQVKAPWEDFCVATFTEDYPVTDGFGDVAFTAKQGERYLVTEFDSSFGRGATLLFLTDAGPEEFTVEMTAAAGEFPFSSNCTGQGDEAPFIAAFTDVSVYEDEALSVPLCELTAGSSKPAQGGVGYAAVGLNFSGPNTYEIQLNAFAEDCGGATSGYISVPQTEIHGTTTWLLPILRLLAPAE